MQTLTDNALMLKVKSGELDKLGLLYERHKKRLFGFFYNMNTNASLSEDLVQNVFMRMLKYKHTFTGEGSFTSWMFTTARNVNYDHFRKEKKMRGQGRLTDDIYNIGDPSETEGQLHRKEQLSQLQRALRELAPDKREVLVLSKYKDLKFSQIAGIIGCSEGAAKVKAHRALKELKSIFMQLENK